MFEIFASYELNPDLKSTVIDRAQQCGFTHVGLIFGGKKIWHATGEGFGSLEGEAFDAWVAKHGFYARFPIKVRNVDYAEGFCRGNEGKDYSESNLAGIQIPWLRKLCADGASELICCEFVLRFCAEEKICGLELPTDPDFIDLAEALKLVLPLKAEG